MFAGAAFRPEKGCFRHRRFLCEFLFVFCAQFSGKKFVFAGHFPVFRAGDPAAVAENAIRFLSFFSARGGDCAFQASARD